jgi:hypothetical protein
MSSGDWVRRVERNEQYLFLPLSASLFESLLQGIYLFIEILIHVGFEHPIPVIAEPFSRCEHQIDHDMHPRQGWKGGKHCAFGMMVDGKTRTLRPLPVPC